MIALARTGKLPRPASHGYEVIEGQIAPELLVGWREDEVAAAQYAAFAPLLQRMRKGSPREDFVALAEAVRSTEIENPLLIETGCGSAWNAEVLAYLLQRPFRYIGMDYSAAMTALGQQHYPDLALVVGDATTLPFRDQSCDILVAGTVLMHLVGYREALRESRRVARRWCIFHTIPVTQTRPTTLIKKYAYNSLVVEVVFNLEEFETLIARNNLAIRRVLKNIPHDYLSETVHERVVVQTYVCEAI
jgi:ubiquinone/menaquinone biosynthesis C-methylase UbiE